MHRAAIFFAAIAVAFGLSTVHFYRQHGMLEQEIARIRADYEQQFARQQQEYQADIRDLQQYLFSQYNYQARQAENEVAPSATNDNGGAVIPRQAATLFQNRNLENSLDQKYADMFPELSLSRSDEDKLKKLLLDRESILGLSAVSYYADETAIKDNAEQQQVLLAGIDNKISALLDSDDYYRYELLKDSGFEQYQMKRFSSGLPEGEQLNREQERALLLAKLKNKKIFENTLKTASYNRSSASQTGREQARVFMEDTLNNYKNNFLQEARLFLTEQQYRQLRDHEAQQFNEMRQSLNAELTAAQ
jgi:hypothetical protein